MEPLPRAFDVAVFQNDFAFSRKPSALLEACDITNNGRHLMPHLGFFQQLVKCDKW